MNVPTTLAATTVLASIALVSCNAPSRANSSSIAQPEPTAGPTTRPELVAKYDALADEILETRRKEVAVVRSILQATYADAASAKERAAEALKAGDEKAARAACESLATLVAQLAMEGDASVARVRKRLIEGGHHFNPLPVGAGQAGGAHHGDKKDPSHHADGKPPAHHADGKPPAGHAEGKAPAHHADGKPPAGHAEGKAPAHHADGKPPAGHAQDPAHHAQHGQDGHHAGESAMGYDPGCVVVTRGAKKTFLEASKALAQLSTQPSAAPLEAEWSKVSATWTALDGGGKD